MCTACTSDIALPIIRLGITLELTISIVKNSRVRRDKADVQVPDFVADIKQLSQRYSNATAAADAAGSSQSPMSRAVWEAIKLWDEMQVWLASCMLWFWHVCLVSIRQTRLSKIESSCLKLSLNA